MRYAPRAELSRAVQQCDLIQVVAGGPALACAVIGAGPPTFLQVATRARWERQSHRIALPRLERLWSDVMTEWTSRLEFRAITGVDGVLVENTRMLEFVQSAGQDRVALAPPGVDTDRFRPNDSGWSASGYLLSVCRLGEPRKRLDRLIRSYYELVNINASTPDLVLAGRGRLPERIWRLADSLGITSRIHLQSDVPTHELPDLYRGASAYVQTSDEEGLGISVMEAMSTGLPVVATDTAGARALVTNEVTGYLTRLDNESLIAQSIAHQLRRVLTQTGADLAAHGRVKAVVEFSTRHALSKFITMYDSTFAS